MLRNTCRLIVFIAFASICSFGVAQDNPVRALPAFIERPIEGDPYPDGERSRVWMQVCDRTVFGTICGEHRFDIKRNTMPLGAPREADAGVSSLFMYGFFQLATATVGLEEPLPDKAYAGQAFATAVMALHVLSNIVNLETITYVWDALWDAKFDADEREAQGICGRSSAQVNAVYAETLFHKIQALMASFNYDDTYEVVKAIVVEAVRALTLDARKVVEVESLMTKESTWVSAWRQKCGPENLSLRPGTNGTLYPNDYVCRPNSDLRDESFFSLVGGLEFCNGCKGWLDEVEPVANINRLYRVMDFNLAHLSRKKTKNDQEGWWNYFTPSTYRRFLQGALGNYKTFNGLSKADYALNDFKKLTEGSQFYASIPLDVLNRVLSLLSAWGKQADAWKRQSRADELAGVYEQALMEYEQARAILMELEQSLLDMSNSETEALLFEELQRASELLEERKEELDGLEATYHLAKMEEEKAQQKDMYAKAALFEASVRMVATMTKQFGGVLSQSKVSKRVADAFNLASPVVLTPTSIYAASEHAIQIKQEWDLKEMAQTLMMEDLFSRDPELMAVLEGIVDHSQMMDYVAMFIDVLGALRNTLALLASTLRVSAPVITSLASLSSDSNCPSQAIAVQEMIVSYLSFALWSFTGNLSFSKIVLSIFKDWQLDAREQEVLELQEAIAQAKGAQDYEGAVALSLRLLRVDASEMAKLLLTRIKDPDYSVYRKACMFLNGLGLTDREIEAIRRSQRAQDAQKLIQIKLQIG